jgi:hypothetical protein
MSLDDGLGDLPDSRRLELVLGLRLERAEVVRNEDVLERALRDLDACLEAENACLVERLAGRVVLLPVAETRARVRQHDDPGLGPSTLQRQELLAFANFPFFSSNESSPRLPSIGAGLGVAWVLPLPALPFAPPDPQAGRSEEDGRRDEGNCIHAHVDSVSSERE